MAISLKATPAAAARLTAAALFGALAPGGPVPAVSLGSDAIAPPTPRGGDDSGVSGSGWVAIGIGIMLTAVLAVLCCLLIAACLVGVARRRRAPPPEKADENVADEFAGTSSDADYTGEVAAAQWSANTVPCTRTRGVTSVTTCHDGPSPFAGVIPPTVGGVDGGGGGAPLDAAYSTVITHLPVASGLGAQRVAPYSPPPQSPRRSPTGPRGSPRAESPSGGREALQRRLLALEGGLPPPPLLLITGSAAEAAGGVVTTVGCSSVGGAGLGSPIPAGGRGGSLLASPLMISYHGTPDDGALAAAGSTYPALSAAQPRAAGSYAQPRLTADPLGAASQNSNRAKRIGGGACPPSSPFGVAGGADFSDPAMSAPFDPSTPPRYALAAHAAAAATATVDASGFLSSRQAASGGHITHLVHPDSPLSNGQVLSFSQRLAVGPPVTAMALSQLQFPSSADPAATPPCQLVSALPSDGPTDSDGASDVTFDEKIFGESVYLL
jgi:hypothetical protein